MLNFTVENMDPEWTAFAKCPYEGCKALTLGCCSQHVTESMNDHINESH